MPTWEFYVTISGSGNSLNEAFCNAIEAFAEDPGIAPDERALISEPLSQAEFAQMGGKCCPFCQNDLDKDPATIVHPFQMDGPNAWQVIYCDLCTKRHIALYKLYGWDNSE